MAASISTQADLLDAQLIPRNTLELFNTSERKADTWASVHERAWTEVKEDLLVRAPPVEEADLTDTSELLRAVLRRVLYIVYRQSEIGGRQEDAKFWLNEYRREMKQVRITVSNVVTQKQGTETFMVRA